MKLAPDGAGASSIVDSSGNNLNGTILSGGPTYNSDVPVNPIPQTGATDNFSIHFAPGDAGKFNYTLPLLNQTNATLEFWINPAHDLYQDVIWPDISQYNIYIPGPWSEPATPQNDLTPCVDYRDLNNNAHEIGCSSVALPVNQWSFVAYVKQSATYSIYVNNSLTGFTTVLAHQYTDSTVIPYLANSAYWTLNGRGVVAPNTCTGTGGSSCPFSGGIDEMRISNTALSPSQFLVSPGFAGAPHFSNCHGQSVAALAHQYGSFAAAVQALGYASETALQSAITSYCGG